MKAPRLFSPPPPLPRKRSLPKPPLSPSSPSPHKDLNITAPSTPALTSPPPTTTKKKPLISSTQWEPLHVARSELSLPLTLPTGQTFRWRQTSPSHYTGVINSHLVSLKHVDDDANGHVAFLHHNPTSSTSSSVYDDLRSYFNLEISLSVMWREFANSDARFAELAQGFDGGVRVLRQDPVECVFQFLCSSNNNIARIEKMVGAIERMGEFLGTVGEFDFYRFPSIKRLTIVSEQQLRDAGFGYRAKYVVGAVRALQSKAGGGEEWLASLRGLELPEVIEELCTLPGVGPKVAACIALFSLDKHHAIPVDTHVWQIATRCFIPELAGARLTPKLFDHVSDAFVARFGAYAGWAQTVLFIGELPSRRKLLPSRDDPPMKEKKFSNRKRVRASARNKQKSEVKDDISWNGA